MDYQELFEVALRAVISLTALFFITRIIGKKQVSELSLFDYVIGISIGNFAAEMTINVDSSRLSGIIAMLIFGITSYLISYLAIKNINLRRFFIGTPTILIQKGQILETNLKKCKISINDLLEQIRIDGYFYLDEVDYALMEANGKITVLPKKINSNVTLKDMNLKVKEQSLTANVIIDGKIIIKNLENMNKDQEWLLKELKIKGSNIKEILLATLDLNNKLTIYKRNKNLKVDDVLE